MRECDWQTIVRDLTAERNALVAEVRELRAMRERVVEAHEKAVDAVTALASWETVTDQPARTVLYAKWGSAMFYRDKLARILGDAATDGGA